MRLAVFHHLPSGGALRALREKILIFKKLGHSVEVFTFSTAEREMFPLEAVAPVFIEPLRFEGVGRFASYLRASRRLAEKIRTRGVDRVWVEKCRFFGSPPILQLLRQPAIFYMQEPLRIRAYEALAPGTGGDSRFLGPPLKASDQLRRLFKAPAHYFIKKQDKKSARAAGKIFANSRYSSAWARAVYGFEAQTLYQGVDTVFFQPDTSIAVKSQVLSVGRLDVSKAHDFAIRVVSRVTDKIRPSLVIVCDQANDEALKALEAQAQLGRVSLEIRSRVSDEDLRMLYGQSRVVLCSAHHEPFGLVPLEAAACGVPVIAVEEGGFKETVLHEKKGFLVPRNVDLWVRYLEVLLVEDAVSCPMALSARAEAVNRWRWDILIPQYEKSLV